MPVCTGMTHPPRKGGGDAHSLGPSFEWSHVHSPKKFPREKVWIKTRKRAGIDHECPVRGRNGCCLEEESFYQGWLKIRLLVTFERRKNNVNIMKADLQFISIP